VQARDLHSILSLGSLLLITALGALLRIWPVGGRALSVFESWTWRDTRDGLTPIIMWEHSRDHPPLHYILVRMCEKLLGGDAEWILRLPSLTAGILCIPAIFLLGRVLHSARLGLVAAIVMAVDLSMVEQSQQARMYTLGMLMLLLTLALLARCITAPRDGIWTWIGLGLLLAACFWAANVGLVLWFALPLGVGMWWMWPKRDDAERTAARLLRRRIGVVYVMAIAASHIGLLHILNRVREGGKTPPPGYDADAARGFMEVVDAIGLLFGHPAMSVLAVLAGVAGVLLLWRRRRVMVLVFIALLVLNGVLVAAVRTDHHHVSLRYFVPMQIPVMLGLGALVVLAERTALRWGATGLVGAIVLVCGITHMRSSGAAPPVHVATGDAIRAIGRTAGAGDFVAYYPAFWETTGTYYELPALLDLDAPASDDAAMMQRVRTCIDNGGQVWIVIGRMWGEMFPAIHVRDAVMQWGRRLEVPIDAAALDAALDASPVVTLRLDRDGMQATVHAADADVMP
jgi:4-amino-4-deoxy-L-arabinose transferase-like glycosyltransferase